MKLLGKLFKGDVWGANPLSQATFTAVCSCGEKIEEQGEVRPGQQSMPAICPRCGMTLSLTRKT